ncbi:MAG: carboxypeptidase M32, partial [Anaerolineales bacterium]|nr:carboxypeptidase M32 [Anaerolineales bacterium]
DAILGKHYPEAGQWAFSLEVLEQLGYDFDRGRQDKTHHPFMIRLGHDDNRVTTRVDEHRLDGLLYSSVHECGHALYEMGTADTWRGTPVDSGTSSGIHESQSRLWENLVGRSRGFWEHFLPTLQGYFPEQLAGVDVDTIYGAVNTVRRSLIRTESDEVTYNLHVLIRFGLELDLLEGRLAVADLPAVWHERYQASLGVHAPSDVDGVLQDVH